VFYILIITAQGGGVYREMRIINPGWLLFQPGEEEDEEN
jgi:hypothetical protein